MPRLLAEVCAWCIKAAVGLIFIGWSPVLTCRIQIGPAALRRYSVTIVGKRPTLGENEAEARLFSSLPLTSEMGQFLTKRGWHRRISVSLTGKGTNVPIADSCAAANELKFSVDFVVMSDVRWLTAMKTERPP